MGVSLLALVIALGGIGIAANGGPLILGQSNTATLETVHTASIADPALRLRNMSTAAGSTALSLQVGAGRPPMQVASQVLVSNFNADRVDSRHANELSRGGRAFDQNFFSIVTFTDKASVTMDIPKPGFVLLNGQTFGDTNSADCNPCFMHVQFRDEENLDTSPPIIVSVRNGDSHAAAVTWLFPISEAGERTFSLEAGIFPGSSEEDVDVRNPAMTALFVPFGPTGTLALGGGQPQTMRELPERLGGLERSGGRSALQ
jgi:hypothetical protein